MCITSCASMYVSFTLEIMHSIKRNGIADVNIDSDTVLPGDGTLLVLGEGKALSRCFHI